MNASKLIAIAIVTTLVLWSAVPVYGDQITIDDFGDEVNLTDFNDLGLSFFNSSGLVIDGNTFITDSGPLRYNADLSISGMSGENLSGFDDLRTVDVEFAMPMFRVGAMIGAPEQAWTASVLFFDENEQELGSILLAGDAFEGEFAGWESAQLIHRMRVIDTASNGFVTAIDDLRFEAVPEPSLLAALMPLAAGACLRRRSRKLS